MSYSILSPDELPIFNSGAVRPFEGLGLAWQLIKDQYGRRSRQIAFTKAAAFDHETLLRTCCSRASSAATA